MSKYIIDIPDGVEWGVVTCRTEDGFYTRDFDSLEELNSDYINEHFGDLQDMAYKRGINDGSLDVKQRVEAAYQRGLVDAWQAARKIVGYTDHGALTLDALGEVFGTASYSCIVRDNTAQEAIDKIKAYEEKQKADDEIKVGDEVQNCHEPDVCFVVASIDTLNEEISGFNRNGHTYSCRPKDAWRKTGRHFDIDKILEEMKE